MDVLREFKAIIGRTVVMCFTNRLHSFIGSLASSVSMNDTYIST